HPGALDHPPSTDLLGGKVAVGCQQPHPRGAQLQGVGRIRNGDQVDHGNKYSAIAIDPLKSCDITIDNDVAVRTPAAGKKRAAPKDGPLSNLVHGTYA